jgi:hypothetical protein
VYVFERTPAGWTEVAALSPPPGAEGHLGQSLALAGPVLLAGAPLAGAVVVYERGPGGWIQTGVLSPADDDAGKSFGTSLAFDGQRAVIGAPDDEEAFVFEPGPGGWQQTDRLEADDEYIETEFGTSVALSGDAIAVGAEGEHEEEGHGGGAVYLFRFGGAWDLEAIVPAPSGGAGMRFGASVALDGDVLAVGSPGDLGGLGRVYAYLGLAGYWFESATLVPYLAGTQGQFGSVVVLDDDELLANIGLDESGVIGSAGYAGAAQSWTGMELGCDPLLRDVAQVSVSAGGAQALLLGGDLGSAYLVLGSATGTDPGMLLGTVAVPLVPDPYFLWTANHPNEGPLVDTFGAWESGSPSIAQLKLPSSSASALVGLTLHHAFVALDPASALLFVQASNAVALELIP